MGGIKPVKSGIFCQPHCLLKYCANINEKYWEIVLIIKYLTAKTLFYKQTAKFYKNPCCMASLTSELLSITPKAFFMLAMRFCILLSDRNTRLASSIAL